MIRLGQSTGPRAPSLVVQASRLPLVSGWRDVCNTLARIRGGRLVVWAVLVCVATARPVRADGGDVTGPKGTARSQKVAFARDIRPILADKCFQCHGPD